MNKTIKSAIEWAEQLTDIVEDPKDSNRGPAIDDIQKAFKYEGVSYCALFAQYCYKRACIATSAAFIFPGTASSQTLFEWAKKAGFIETDFSKLKAGDIVIWRKWKLWQGHVGIVKEVFPQFQSFHTIEGNTSPGLSGSQSNGGGIYQRIRYMKKTDFTVDGFYLRGFISVEKIFGTN